MNAVHFFLWKFKTWSAAVIKSPDYLEEQIVIFHQMPQIPGAICEPPARAHNFLGLFYWAWRDNLTGDRRHRSIKARKKSNLWLGNDLRLKELKTVEKPTENEIVVTAQSPKYTRTVKPLWNRRSCNVVLLRRLYCCQIV